MKKARNKKSNKSPKCMDKILLTRLNFNITQSTNLLSNKRSLQKKLIQDRGSKLESINNIRNQK